jgi:hypothetical protein
MPQLRPENGNQSTTITQEMRRSEITHTEPLAVTATRWPPMALALLRGGIEGFVLGGLDCLVALSFDYSARDSLVSAGIILFARLAISLGVGGIDQWTAAKVRHQ